jgi:hypothetical protein
MRPSRLRRWMAGAALLVAVFLVGSVLGDAGASQDAQIQDTDWGAPSVHVVTR